MSSQWMKDAMAAYERERAAQQEPAANETDNDASDGEEEGDSSSGDTPSWGVQGGAAAKKKGSKHVKGGVGYTRYGTRMGFDTFDYPRQQRKAIMAQNVEPALQELINILRNNDEDYHPPQNALAALREGADDGAIEMTDGECPVGMVACGRNTFAPYEVPCPMSQAGVPTMFRVDPKTLKVETCVMEHAAQPIKDFFANRRPHEILTEITSSIETIKNDARDAGFTHLEDLGEYVMEKLKDRESMDLSGTKDTPEAMLMWQHTQMAGGAMTVPSILRGEHNDDPEVAQLLERYKLQGGVGIDGSVLANADAGAPLADGGVAKSNMSAEEIADLQKRFEEFRAREAEAAGKDMASGAW